MVDVFELVREEFVVNCDRHGESVVSSLCINSVHKVPPRCAACVEEEKLIEAQQREEKERLKLERKKAEALARSAIPKRYMHLEWHDFDLDQSEDAKNVFYKARNYAELFDKIITHGRSLLFCGGTGTGKTMLACLIARHIIGDGYTAIYASASQIFEEYKESFSDQTKKRLQTLYKYSAPSLLIVDEVGVQYGSETERNIISEIVRLRYDDLKPTIFISNFDSQKVSEFLGERVMSRLSEAGGGKIDFTWPDFRTRR